MKPREYSLRDYPKEELYRLVVDGDMVDKEKGWEEYEKREPGCISAFFKALLFATEFVPLDQDLSLTHLRVINYLLGQNVNKSGNSLNPPGKFYEQELSGMLAMFADTHSFNITKLTLNGIRAFIHRIENPFLNQPGFIGPLFVGDVLLGHGRLEHARNKLGCDNNDELAKALFEKFKNGEKVSYKATQHQARLKVKFVLNSLHDSLREIEHKEEKLRIIIEHIQMFEWVHGFGDFNIRTFVLVTLMRLLKKHGFPAPTFENPNMFDLYSVDELVQEVKKGFNQTEIVTDTPEVCTFLTDDLSQEAKDRLEKMTDVFTNGLTESITEEFQALVERFETVEIIEEYLEQFEGMFELNLLGSQMESDEELQMECESKFPEMGEIFEKYQEDGDFEKAYSATEAIFGKYAPIMIHVPMAQQLQAEIQQTVNNAVFGDGSKKIEEVLTIIEEALPRFEPKFEVPEDIQTFQSFLRDMHQTLSRFLQPTQKPDVVVTADLELEGEDTEIARAKV